MVVALGVFLVLAGLPMLLESAAAASAPLYAERKTGSITHYCDQPGNSGDKVFAYYTASSEYSANAPSDADHPQFYSALEGVTVTCASNADRLKITVTGTDPNGLPISGLSFAGGLAAQTSPDDAGTLNGLMTFVFDELVSFFPGATPTLKYLRSGTGLTTGSDSSSAWAQWKKPIEELGGTAKGLHIAFQLAVNTGLKGTYKVRVTSHFEIWHTHYVCPITCSQAVSGVDLTHDLEYCYKRCNPPASNNAQFISHNMPSSVPRGNSVLVTVVMKNTGQTIWWPYDRGSYEPGLCANCESWYRLGSQPSGDMTWGLKRADLPTAAPVLPGQTFTFQFTVTAPTTPGTYYWQWRMVQDNNAGTSVVEWFGAATPNVQVIVTAPSTIDGYVRASGGSPLSATVRSTAPSGATQTAYTNAGGFYSLTVLEQGTYSLTASACGYVSQTKSVTVTWPTTLYHLDFTLTPLTGTGSIAPIHVTEGGGPVAGATVTVRDCSWSTVYTAVTDSNGMVPGVTGLAPGTYTVQAWWEPFPDCPWAGSQTVTVPPSQSPTVEVVWGGGNGCPN